MADPNTRKILELRAERTRIIVEKTRETVEQAQQAIEQTRELIARVRESNRATVQLTAAIDELGQATESDAVTALDELELDLHVRCLGHCPNPELVEALKRTRCILIFGKHLLGREIAFPNEEPFFDEHRRIIDAMMRRDEAAVARETLAHLRKARTKVLDRVRYSRSVTAPLDLPYIKEAV